MLKTAIQPKLATVASICLAVAIAAAPITTGLKNTAMTIALIAIVFCIQWRSVWLYIREYRTLSISLIFFGVLLTSALYGLTPLAEAFREASSYRRLAYLPLIVAFLIQYPKAKRALLIAAAISVLCLIPLALINQSGWLMQHYPIKYSNINTSAFPWVNPIPGSFMVACIAYIGSQYARLASMPQPQRLVALAVFLAGTVVILVYQCERIGMLTYCVLLLFSLLEQWLRPAPNTQSRIIHYTLIAALCLCILAALGFVGPMQARFKLAFSELSPSLSDPQTQVTSIGIRRHLLQHSLQLWLDKPFFGHGMRSFAHLDTLMPHAHNQFLQFAAEQGTMGLAVFIVWLIAPVWDLKRRFYTFGLSVNHSLTYTTVALMMAFGAACMFDCILLTSASDCWILITALLLAHIHTASTELKY